VHRLEDKLPQLIYYDKYLSWVKFSKVISDDMKSNLYFKFNNLIDFESLPTYDTAIVELDEYFENYDVIVLSTLVNALRHYDNNIYFDNLGAYKSNLPLHLIKTRVSNNQLYELIDRFESEFKLFEKTKEHLVD